MRSDSAKFTFELADLTSLVRDAIADTSKLAEENEILVEQLGIPGSVSCVHDRSHLAAAVSIIVDNAIKYSPKGGRITVEVSESDGQVFISITDEGPGLKNEHIPHIFDEFACRDFGHHSNSTGLHLAIAKEIILRHAGTIEASNNDAAGATFRISFRGNLTPSPEE